MAGNYQVGRGDECEVQAPLVCSSWPQQSVHLLRPNAHYRPWGLNACGGVGPMGPHRRWDGSFESASQMCSSQQTDCWGLQLLGHTFFKTSGCAKADRHRRQHHWISSAQALQSQESEVSGASSEKASWQIIFGGHSCWLDSHVFHLWWLDSQDTSIYISSVCRLCEQFESMESTDWRWLQPWTTCCSWWTWSSTDFPLLCGTSSPRRSTASCCSIATWLNFHLSKGAWDTQWCKSTTWPAIWAGSLRAVTPAAFGLMAVKVTWATWYGSQKHASEASLRRRRLKASCRSTGSACT